MKHRRATTTVAVPATSDGSGVAIVVNSSAGPERRADPTDELRRRLPRARLRRVGPDDDLSSILREAATGAAVLGVVGGDGSANAAAAVAHERGIPLLVVPGGTLNHFARDLGVDDLDAALDALAGGRAIAVDLATIDGHPFLNTASFGAYPALVDAREPLERYIGKWPALAVAFVRVLAGAEPCAVDLDDEPHRLWAVFIGNCRYHPDGLAPAWRGRLDDGVLDVRLIDARHPWARTRAVATALVGRLRRSPVYDARTVKRIEIRSRSGPMRLARDGETFDGPVEIVVEKADRPLAVYAPT